MNTQTVQAIMHIHPISIQCQTPLPEIISTLAKSQQAQLPVINKSNKLLGMVSLVDCQNALLIGAYHCDKPIKVNDIMSKEFIHLDAQEGLSEVVIKTQHQTETTFPVLASGKLIGVVHRVDLLTHLHNHFSGCSVAK